MPMTVEQIEAEVLKLPEQAQVDLLGRLMRSLADTMAIDPDVAEAWAQEAIRRDEDDGIGLCRWDSCGRGVCGTEKQREMTQAIFHPVARRELEEAIDYYNAESQG